MVIGNCIESAGGVVIGPRGIALVSKLRQLKKRDKEKGEMWSLPKGAIEDGEDEITGARREIREETGIDEDDLELVRFLATVARVDEDGRAWKKIMFFLFTTEHDAKLEPQDDKIHRALWTPRKEVADRLFYKEDRLFFETNITKALVRECALV
ncbi:NUDIX domain-containing protein [Candidatus Peregrinibacteria bacterium]|nr:NUDIX domain-containing protein [Candidatus Peregrinibacteria bacterium]